MRSGSGPAAAAAVLVLSLGGTALAQSATHSDTEEGKRLFKADCAGCHKWHGNGGGGYGGAALSLRQTQLTREQIIETVTCGRPGTGMPYHKRDAYQGDDKSCYGMTRADLGKDVPPGADQFLRPPEIEKITDYVLVEVKGKGEPNLADCEAFWGRGSRLCHEYQPGQAGGGGQAAPKSGD
jgi:mono/diheme cytochrome c family protein